jgi:hypothetical protein
MDFAPEPLSPFAAIKSVPIHDSLFIQLFINMKFIAIVFALCVATVSATGSCFGPLNPAVSCHSNNQCPGKYWCKNNCCAPLQPVGCSCTINEDCEGQNNWCRHGVCTPLSHPGQHCEQDRDCLGHIGCKSGICKA